MAELFIYLLFSKSKVLKLFNFMKELLVLKIILLKEHLVEDTQEDQHINLDIVVITRTAFADILLKQ